MIEETKTFSLSIDAPVHFCRPAIDVLFESAGDTYGAGLIGILLTGANSDGSQGLKKIKQSGGLTLVQDPGSAEFDVMPQAAVDAGAHVHVLGLSEIPGFLNGLRG